MEEPNKGPSRRPRISWEPKWLRKLARIRSKEAYGLDLIMIGLLASSFAALASLTWISSSPALSERQRLARKI